MPSATHLNAPRSAAASERRMKVLSFWNAGVPYNKIAEQLGISLSTVGQDIKLGLREAVQHSTDQIVARQLTVLRDIRKGCYQGVLSGDPQAASTMIKALEHEAKLFGLYAPQRIAISVSDEEFALTAAKLMAGMDMTPPPSMLKNRAEAVVIDMPRRMPIDPKTCTDEELGCTPEREAAEPEPDDWIDP